MGKMLKMANIGRWKLEDMPNICLQGFVWDARTAGFIVTLFG
jgi:hypothetical protein